MNVQYWTKDRVWRDVQPLITDLVAGLINIPWDTSNLYQDILAVRIRAVDSLGIQHFSNALTTASIFSIVSPQCSTGLSADNSLLEKLSLLKLQVKSGQDNRYPDWTDFKVYDASRDDVPEGGFSLSPPPYYPGMSYQIRMQGTGASGNIYNAETVFPSTCPIEISLDVDVKEADCGFRSNSVVLKTQITHNKEIFSASLKTLKYYINKTEGLQLLRGFNNVQEGLSTTVDTSIFAEGSYPIKAVLAYTEVNSNILIEVTSDITLIVDRVLPAAQIAYPSKSTMICPIKMSDTKSDWYGIHVEGKATDNNQVKRYELSYGTGENPSLWMPATTLTGGQSKAIVGEGAKQGAFGAWDVTNLKDASLSLKLKVVDAAGNSSCAKTSFSMDTLAEITNVAADKTLFSPNSDGTLDDITVSYRIDEYASTGVKVYKLIKTEGPEILDSSPVRTIVSDGQHLGGAGNAAWDGKGDSGTVVADGRYGIAVSAADSCGNTAQKWAGIEVDNTPPNVAISSPRAGDPLGNIVEVRGTAEDLHFKSFALEAGQGDMPASWTSILSGAAPITSGILGKWNIFDLSGKWTLKLSAVDAAGNKNETRMTLDLGTRQNLIKSLDVAPKLFSPNDDGKLEAVTVTYELTDVCDITTEIIDPVGTVKWTVQAAAVPAGVHSQVWDGRDGAGMPVADAQHRVKLTAALSADASVTQAEAVTVTLDSTQPAVDITQPANNAYIRTDVTLNGSITDVNMQEYSLAYSDDAGTVSIDQGSQSRSNYTFGTLADLAEGGYTLMIKAKDLAENSTDKTIAFTIDRTPPVVKIDAPKDGEYYGGDKNVINISGSIVEKNLETYSVRYGSGDNPAQWTELSSGRTLPVIPLLYAWNVGSGAGIPDGLYTLSLYARDTAGSDAEVRVKVTVDNTAPEAFISSPKEGDYVTASIDIAGTASDQYLDTYAVEMSEGKCDAAFKWAPIKTGTVPVQNGKLARWETLPPDGEYCLRLAVVDKLGNKAEAKVNVKMDTHPPAAPVLSGELENTTNARLTWARIAEPDIAGYNVSRNSLKINTIPVSDLTYLDQNPGEGVHTYTLKAVDLAGGESVLSNEVKLTVDTIGPDARIRAPLDGVRVSGLYDIKGIAYSLSDFNKYRTYFAQGADPSAWTLLRESPVPISYGTLAQWDTFGLGDGAYSIKLEAEDLTGNITTHQVSVIIDNSPPAAPTLVSAVPNVSNLTLTWIANSDADLAGYLIYRNDQFANASGAVFGDLKPYLVTGTAYIDKALPDGTFAFSLVAVDQAGNVSDPSNSINVNIDTHAPHATIVEPLNKSMFGNNVLVKAETPDLDASSVQFQYKRNADATWTNIGSAATMQPFITYFDPTALALTYGDYNLRAVATDRGGKTDGTPPVVTITYTDLKAPSNLLVRTVGNNATLTWSSNGAVYLNGYNLYRTSGGAWTKINTTLISGTVYQDNNLSDGVYTYKVTVVDGSNNEGEPANTAPARVYAPVIEQPQSPTAQRTLQLNGSNAAANATVEIAVQAASGAGTIVAVSADPSGNFHSSIDLTEGENRVTASAIDSDDNVSRVSDTVALMYHEPPAVPTGLTATVLDRTVNLTWNLNPEPDIAGYNLYRNNRKINQPSPVTAGTASASSSEYYDVEYNFNPELAFDNNPGTFWLSACCYSESPEWWQLDLPQAEPINRIDIQWVLEGMDYEIQVWIGSEWVTAAAVIGNTDTFNSIEFDRAYSTTKIRVYSSGMNIYGQFGIGEVSLFKGGLLTAASFGDANLVKGIYDYAVTAVDAEGFESASSTPVQAIVGDFESPAVPLGLVAAPEGSNILLTWTPNSESDLSGYDVYRKDGQSWIKENGAPIASAEYRVANLKNGGYIFRVTAGDLAGNESEPSNEAAAEISIVVPVPFNLRISAVQGRAALNVAWDYVAGSPARYNIYRGISSGGPYYQVNALLINEQLYTDEGLTSGTSYYYVVAAVDPSGNDSDYSDEVVGIPTDTVAPSQPKIFFPATPVMPVVLYTNQTGISGTAEPDSTVDVSINGGLQGTAISREHNEIFKTTLNYYYSNGLDLSRDGNRVVFSDGSSKIWIKDLRTGMTIDSGQYGSAPKWSPDSKQFLYSSSSRLYIYDCEKASRSPLTGDMYYEYGGVWSLDGQRIAFFTNRNGSYEIWIKNMHTDDLMQISFSGYAIYPKWSPDGKNMAYRDSSGGFYFINIESGEPTLIETGIYDFQYEWSPDAGSVVYVKNNALWIIDVKTQNKTLLTPSGLWENKPVWSPDGQKVLFVYFESSLNKYSLGWRDVATGERTVVTSDGITANPSDILWSRSGRIAYSEPKAVNLIDLKGQFRLNELRLLPGENRITATAKDESGNTSIVSDSITVVYDTSQMPDVEIRADDVFLYPPYPLAGKDVAVNAVVWNRGQMAVRDVDVDLYMWDSSGNLTLVKSERISSLAAGDGTIIDFTWNSGSHLGVNTVVAVVDPVNTIQEFRETNNVAMKEITVVANESVVMTTSLDAQSYQTGQNVNVRVNLKNPGREGDVTVSATIEDENGYIVTGFDPQGAHLAYASERDLLFSWDTGSVFDGSYMAHAVLRDSSGIVTENVVPFTIAPDAVMELSLVTDKLGYGPYEDVGIDFTITNGGKNTIVPELIAKTRISDAGGVVLFNDEKSASNLLPGARVSLSSFWNTGLNLPGEYHADLELFRDNQLISMKSVSFAINASLKMSGSITTALPVVSAENQVQTTYTVMNSGNVDVGGGMFKVLVSDLETGEITEAFSRPATINRGESVTDMAPVPTQGLGLKTYTLLLQYSDTASTLTLASTSMTIKDMTSPVVTILSPVAGTPYTTTVSFLVTASDDASGIDWIEYRRDDGSWSLLPVSDPASGKYGATWDPTMDDNGIHRISFRAMDKAGNASDPVTVSYEVRINRAPTTLAPAAPADGADVGTSLPELKVNNASDPNNDLLTYTFEIYADSDLTVMVVEAGGIAEGTGTTSWQVPQELSENARYFWRARAFDGKLYGEWMSTAAFRVNTVDDPPSAPVPTNPDDGTEVSTLTPALTVINAVDPDSISLTYNFQVALDPAFTQFVTSALGVSAGLGTTSWQVPVLLAEDVWYYWRAQADDWIIQGDWSAPSVRFFVNTGNDAPTAPSIIAPSDNSEITTTTPDVVLQNSTDPDSPAITYSIELDTVRTFDSPALRRMSAIPQGQGTTTWSVDGLLDNTGYFVRVKASDGAAESDWSLVNAFFVNTRNDAPSAAVPANPSDGAGVNVFTPILSVQNATDLDRNILTYDFEVYEDSALSMPAASSAGVVEMQETTSWTVSATLKENRTYYWRARAYDGELASEWTAPLSFTVNTGNDAPTAPTIVFPAEGGSVDIAMPTLTGLNATDPDSSRLTYDFEVFYDSAMIWTATGIAEGTAGSISATLSVALTDNTVYSWRCRASDGERDGAWTAMTKFTVHLPRTGITVDIAFEPETLNQKSNGDWVTVEIELPHGYNASDIDIASIRLEGTIPAVEWPYEKGKRRHEHGCEHEHAEHDHSKLKVKFRRSDVIAVLPAGNLVQVHITGTVAGTQFEGVDIIRLIH